MTERAGLYTGLGGFNLETGGLLLETGGFISETGGSVVEWSASPTHAKKPAGGGRLDVVIGKPGTNAG
ncbi:hypothetical protein [Sporosarcina koreensis]|uniref:hypothetical protein n=1 Tax=Sporosarcina koreensis TaxID=334735 RepID=UPI000B2F5DC6|nr:hypothetical protein [Sporosarcina koreensis]